MEKLTWKTDRNDLVEAVRTLSAVKARSIYKKFIGRLPPNVAQQQLYNELMVRLLRGEIPEDALK